VTVIRDRLARFPIVVIAPFFLWGTAMVAMKDVMPLTTPDFIAGVRLLPAGVLVLAAAIALGRPQPRGWKAWGWIGLFALVDGTMFQGFLAQGLARTGAGLGSVTIDSQPLAVAILSSILFGEAIRAWGWVGLAFGILGISCIGLPDAWILGALHGDLALPPGQNLVDSGVGLMLLVALSMAGGTVLIRYVCKHADPIAATGWHMVLGGIPLFALSGLTETNQWGDLTLSGWLALTYASVFGGAIAYGIFFFLASEGNLTSFSALTFLTPVFALAFSSVLLDERLSAVQWTGVGLTLISVYVINQRDRLPEQLRALVRLGAPPESSAETSEHEPVSTRE